MSDNELWFASLSGVIFTQFKQRFKSLVTTTEYRKIKFTNTNSEIVPSHFPTIYLREADPVEDGNTLDGATINAIVETIQVEVYTNAQEKDTRTLMNKAILVMKQMRFGVATMPIYTTDHEMKHGVARFRRIIGADDTF